MDALLLEKAEQHLKYPVREVGATLALRNQRSNRVRHPAEKFVIRNGEFRPREAFVNQNRRACFGQDCCPLSRLNAPVAALSIAPRRPDTSLIEAQCQGRLIATVLLVRLCP